MSSVVQMNQLMHIDFITEERLQLEENLKPDDILVTGDSQQSGIDHQPL